MVWIVPAGNSIFDADFTGNMKLIQINFISPILKGTTLKSQVFIWTDFSDFVGLCQQSADEST
uniref:Uncharacterized protein n=1 Tax=Romanomermis culicivorax TaxID=13658 RepID=A0A915HKY4_ROMCU